MNNIREILKACSYNLDLFPRESVYYEGKKLSIDEFLSANFSGILDCFSKDLNKCWNDVSDSCLPPAYRRERLHDYHKMLKGTQTLYDKIQKIYDQYPEKFTIDFLAAVYAVKESLSLSEDIPKIHRNICKNEILLEIKAYIPEMAETIYNPEPKKSILFAELVGRRSWDAAVKIRNLVLYGDMRDDEFYKDFGPEWNRQVFEDLICSFFPNADLDIDAYYNGAREYITLGREKKIYAGRLSIETLREDGIPFPAPSLPYTRQCFSS